MDFDRGTTSTGTEISASDIRIVSNGVDRLGSNSTGSCKQNGFLYRDKAAMIFSVTFSVIPPI
jgi:hypothetical protein